MDLRMLHACSCVKSILLGLINILKEEDIQPAGSVIHVTTCVVIDACGTVSFDHLLSSNIYLKYMYITRGFVVAKNR